MPASSEDPAPSGFGLRPGHARQRPPLPLIGALTALGALALFVAFFLPSSVTTVVSPTPAVVAPPVPASAPRADASPAPASDASRAEAEKLMPEVLRRVARLEGEGVRQWGQEPVGGASLPAVEEIIARVISA